jgi:hypothetical protein
MTGGRAAPRKPQPPAPGGLVEQIKALRNDPRRATLYGAGALVLLVLLGYAWTNRAAETWVTVAPTEMHLAVGQSQPLTVSFMHKPHFLWRGTAHPIAGTIQLISFPEAVDVAPTTIVTTRDTPQANLKVTGLHAGTEELILAGSNRPTESRSWQTTSMQVVVTR